MAGIIPQCMTKSQNVTVRKHEDSPDFEEGIIDKFFKSTQCRDNSVALLS